MVQEAICVIARRILLSGLHDLPRTTYIAEAMIVAVRARKHEVEIGR
jgi:hypothetical protein